MKKSTFRLMSMMITGWLYYTGVFSSEYKVIGVTYGLMITIPIGYAIGGLIFKIVTKRKSGKQSRYKSNAKDLTELHALLEKGAITEKEFAKAKKKIIKRI